MTSTAPAQPWLLEITTDDGEAFHRERHPNAAEANSAVRRSWSRGAPMAGRSA